MRRSRHLRPHVTEFGSYHWKRLIAFRDHLRANPEDAAAYVRLKQELVGQFADQPRAYTAAKASFVREMRRNRGSRGSSYLSMSLMRYRPGTCRSTAPIAVPGAPDRWSA